MSDINQARQYGVSILPASVPPGTAYWRVSSVRHLPGDQNRGRHHIFIRAFDAAGQRDRTPTLRVYWEWEGQRPGEKSDPVRLDKGDSDTGHADIPMEKGQIIMIHLAGDGAASEAVDGLHAMHNDEGPGNTWGHHSFVVEFQKTVATSQPTEPPPTEPPTEDDALLQRVRMLENQMIRFERTLKQWAAQLVGEL